MLKQLPVNLSAYFMRINAMVDFNNTTAKLVRYERINGKHNGFGGEHISVLYDSKNQLLGFANMTQDYVLDKQKCIAHDHAYRQAINFLRQFAPDIAPKNAPQEAFIKDDKMPASLSSDIDLHWIALHSDEQIKLNDRICQVGGMKVKMQLRSKPNQWMWVILNQKGQVCVFERNIQWDMVAKKRKSEKWLHDYNIPLNTDSETLIMTEKMYADFVN